VTPNDAAMTEFQSTPPRGRRPAAVEVDRQIELVSIHASAREATTAHAADHVAALVSIHASAREATWLKRNARSIADVSIHASAREATNLPSL